VTFKLFVLVSSTGSSYLQLTLQSDTTWMSDNQLQLSSVKVVFEVISTLVPLKKSEDTAVGIHHADHVTPSVRKSWH
jgi:hypothetical protein